MAYRKGMTRVLPGTGEPSQCMITVRMGLDLRDALNKLAEDKCVSQNQLVAGILRKAANGYLTDAREKEVTNAAGEVS